MSCKIVLDAFEKQIVVNASYSSEEFINRIVQWKIDDMFLDIYEETGWYCDVRKFKSVESVIDWEKIYTHNDLIEQLYLKNPIRDKIDEYVYFDEFWKWIDVFKRVTKDWFSLIPIEMLLDKDLDWVDIRIYSYLLFIQSKVNSKEIKWFSWQWLCNDLWMKKWVLRARIWKLRRLWYIKVEYEKWIINSFIL